MDSIRKKNCYYKEREGVKSNILCNGVGGSPPLFFFIFLLFLFFSSGAPHQQLLLLVKRVKNPIGWWMVQYMLKTCSRCVNCGRSLVSFLFFFLFLFFFFSPHFPKHGGWAWGLALAAETSC